MPKVTENTIVFFNNCQNRPHAQIFGDERAFFDLNTTGLQAAKALNLSVGQECVVVSIGPEKRLLFSWLTLQAETRLRDDKGTECRVFLGQYNALEEMTKAKARNSKRYSPFFNSEGNFKRQSVAYGDVQPKHRLIKANAKQTATPDEVDISGHTYLEGSVNRIWVNTYERSASARTECLDHHGRACAVCEMSFAELYGPEAADHIHVHHLKPLSDLKKSYKVDPIKDLIPVCPNCHAVIHLGGKTRSLDEVRSMMSKRSAGG